MSAGSTASLCLTCPWCTSHKQIGTFRGFHKALQHWWLGHITAFTREATEYFLIIYFTPLGKNSLEMFICVRELTVQRLGRAPIRGWLPSRLAGEAMACQLWLPPCREHAVTGLCREELSKEKDDSVRGRGKTPNKRGWNGVISFFLCNLQHTAKPSRCHMTGRQKAFSAVTGFTAPAKTTSYLLVPFRDLHVLLYLQAKGKPALAVIRCTDTKCLLQYCWHSAYG